LAKKLEERELERKGSPTDGSNLYPAPIRTVCGDVPHQLCTFHVITELTTGGVKAVAKERECLGQAQPQLPRGRPSSQEKDARRLARNSTSIPQKISDVFQARSVFVTRRLQPSERTRLMQSPRGLPPVRKLREIMDHMYAWFDRRCRTQTALGKLKKLRQWGSRFPWMGDT
jgi:hypothetical protein